MVTQPNLYTGLISGGLMGSDPFDASSWSGSSRALFTSMQRAGILAEAVGVDLPKAQFLLHAAPHFSTDKEVWRRRVYRSPSYRQALSKKLPALFERADKNSVLLQLGAYVNARTAWSEGKIFTYQDGNALEYFESPFAPEALRKDCKRNAATFAFEKTVAQDADKVLTTSHYLANSFRDRYDVPQDKIAVIGCGMNVPLPETIPERDWHAAELLFIGKEFARKGGDDLLKAFAVVRKRFPNAKLHIVGPKSGEMQDGVIWHGFLDRRDGAQWDIFKKVLSSATLFVLPSLYEPFGIAPLEAMGWGMPAIVTGKWALRENVIAAEHGAHCETENPALLADILIAHLETPDQLANMGAKARSHVLENFTWVKVCERLAALLPA